MIVLKAAFADYRYAPQILVDINSDENLLSIVRKFVPLHTGTF